jgi:hypothetical protein
VGVIVIDDKETALIVKLHRLTAQNKVAWAVTDPPRALWKGTDDQIPLFVRTEYKGRNFAMFERRYQAFNMDTESTYWTDKIVLAILDDDDRVLWETRDATAAIYDLFETVRRKVSDVDGILDDLLQDEDDES